MTPERSSLRWTLTRVVPVLVLLAMVIGPLALGTRTLVLRDVLNTHLGLRAYLGDAIRAGHLLPLLDPLRAGGQGLAGNANAVPLYPDNLLLVVASDLWQLNAHFWLHWLLTLGAAYWLGREWGLGREGAWASAVAWGLSGVFVSQLNLYNAVAVVAWAPALAAALLATRRQERRGRALALLGALWALELLGGDPLLALIALAGALALAMPFRRELPLGGVALALTAGCLIAAPQIGETLRLLPASFRSFWGTERALQAKATPGPAGLIDLLLPFYFGRPDLQQTWGNVYFGGVPPLYFSLAPGVLVLALAAVGLRRPDRAVRWAAGTALVAGLLTYSGGALVALAARLPGGGLMRYGVKFVLPAALAGALLAGRGLERALADPEARTRLLRALTIAAALFLALLLLFALPGNLLEAPFRRVLAQGVGDHEFGILRRYWAVLALFQLLVTGAGLGIAALATRWRSVAVVTLLVVQTASQLWLLRPMLPTDEAAIYRRPSPLLDVIPADAVLAYAGLNDLFGTGAPRPEDYPDSRLLWLSRRAQRELYPFAGLEAGRRYEFDYSPEGLDSFLVHSITLGMEHFTDEQRLRVLAATGVDRLLVGRRLDPSTGGLATLDPNDGGVETISLYRVERPLAEASLLATVRHADNVNRALEQVLSRSFDPWRDVVIAGSGTDRDGEPGSVRTISSGAERIELDADSENGGVLVVRRAWLPIWRATIDGTEARPVVANLTRLAVELPPGSHRVRFFVGRRPLVVELAGSTLGALLLAGLGSPWFGGRRRGAEGGA